MKRFSIVLSCLLVLVLQVLATESRAADCQIKVLRYTSQGWVNYVIKGGTSRKLHLTNITRLWTQNNSKLRVKITKVTPFGSGGVKWVYFTKTGQFDPPYGFPDYPKNTVSMFEAVCTSK